MSRLGPARLAIGAAGAALALLLAACAGPTVSGPYRLGSFEAAEGGGVRIVRASGELDRRDPLGRRDAWVDAYTFEGEAGERVILSLRSTSIDCYAYLFDAAGTLVGENDDVRAGVLDSHLEVVLPHTGAYRIEATSYSPGQRGPYDVRLERRDRPRYPILDGAEAVRFALGSPSGLPAEAFRAYALRLPADGSARVTARASAQVRLFAFDARGDELASAGPGDDLALDVRGEAGAVAFVVVVAKTPAGGAEVSLARAPTSASP